MIIGFAKDIHKLKKQKNASIKLANLEFQEDYCIQAHSDGDIILHALADAILSAIGENDIGYYFSDKNPDNHNLDSLTILNFALAKLAQTNYLINNIDLTIVCNQINILNKKQQILAHLQKLLQTSLINIKGKRFEQKNNTIECYCVLLLSKKG